MPVLHHISTTYRCNLFHLSSWIIKMSLLLIWKAIRFHNRNICLLLLHKSRQQIHLSGRTASLLRCSCVTEDISSCVGILSVYVLVLMMGLLYCCNLLGNEVTVRAHTGCSEIVSTYTLFLLFRGLYCTNRPTLIHKIKFYSCLWMLLTGFKVGLYRPPQQIIFKIEYNCCRSM